MSGIFSEVGNIGFFVYLRNMRVKLHGFKLILQGKANGNGMQWYAKCVSWLLKVLTTKPVFHWFAL